MNSLTLLLPGWRYGSFSVGIEDPKDITGDLKQARASQKVEAMAWEFNVDGRIAHAANGSRRIILMILSLY